MSNENTFYFGCWGQAGHFLWNSHRQYVSDHDIRRLKLPTASQLDGTTLFLPQEVIGKGAITYLPGPNLTVFAWWGNNPWDERGKVNNAIITMGDTGKSVTWKMFTRYFPGLANVLKLPEIY